MPRYIELSAVADPSQETIQLKAEVMVDGIWHRSMRFISSDAIRADGAKVLASLLRQMAEDIEKA